jgi:hypothetical protein
MACHSTSATPGERAGQFERANNTGTGHASSTEMAASRTAAMIMGISQSAL